MHMSPGRIIVAEDNRILQDVIRFNLARAGYEVLTASDGVEALELIRAHQIDMLVTDCQMPRMSGIELVTALRSDPRVSHMPVLFCTAKGFEIDPKTLDELNLPQVVCKPFSPAELIQRVGVMLARSRADAEPQLHPDSANASEDSMAVETADNARE
jgi:DNA-binding response OmpR family regulator